MSKLTHQYLNLNYVREIHQKTSKLVELARKMVKTINTWKLVIQYGLLYAKIQEVPFWAILFAIPYKNPFGTLKRKHFFVTSVGNSF